MWIEDPSDTPPVFFKKTNFLVYPTATLIAINCDCKILGAKTEFILGDVTDLNMSSEPVYEGVLKTPSRIISIRSIVSECILEMAVPDIITNVRIWTNKSRYPDVVTIGVF